MRMKELSMLMAATFVMSISIGCGNAEKTQTNEGISKTIEENAEDVKEVAVETKETTEFMQEPTSRQMQETTEVVTEQVPEPTSESTPVHEHNYSSKIIVQATCGSEGKKLYECGCGSSYEESYSDSKNHVGGETIHYYREATCNEGGLGNYFCNTCGALRIEETPKLEHIPWDYWHYYPEEGYYVKGCQRNCHSTVIKTYTKPEGEEIVEITGLYF